MRRLSLLLLLWLWAAPALALQPPHDWEALAGVECLDCHAMFTPNLLPRGDVQEQGCKTCHHPGGQAGGEPRLYEVTSHRTAGGAVLVDCGSCHSPHGPQTVVDPRTGVAAENRSLIRGDTAKYVPGAREPAVFHERPRDFARPAGDPPADGICQTCHTDTRYHRGDGGGGPHGAAGGDCTMCHPHDSGFLPTRGCVTCHEGAQGVRRQIAGAGGDFERRAHHVDGPVQDADCATCHWTSGHRRGTVRLLDPDEGYRRIHLFDPGAPEALAPFCLGCHDGDGALAGAGDRPLSDGRLAPDIRAFWAVIQGAAAPAHAEVGCLQGCHDNAHGSDKAKLLGPADGAAVPPDLAAEQEGFCFDCHPEIEAEFARFVAHPLRPAEIAPVEGTPPYARAVECTTCHDPHAATAEARVKLPGDAHGRWGDEAGEKMTDYARTLDGAYAAPVGHPSTPSAIDAATFCTECHGAGHRIHSVAHGRDLEPIAWSETEVASAGGYHGGIPRCDVPQNARQDYGFLIAPFDDPAVTNWVLSCTDCHEPHGSDRPYMLRSVVNGIRLEPWSFRNFCTACHQYNGHFAFPHGAVAPCTDPETGYYVYCPDEPPTIADQTCNFCHGHGEKARNAPCRAPDGQGQRF